MLILTRRVDESIIIGDDIVVSVVDIKGDQVKLGIDAPKEVKVYRREVYDAIQAENLAAAKASAVLPAIQRLADSRRPAGTTPPAPSRPSERSPDRAPKEGDSSSRRREKPPGDAGET